MTTLINLIRQNDEEWILFFRNHRQTDGSHTDPFIIKSELIRAEYSDRPDKRGLLSNSVTAWLESIVEELRWKDGRMLNFQHDFTDEYLSGAGSVSRLLNINIHAEGDSLENSLVLLSAFFKGLSRFLGRQERVSDWGAWSAHLFFTWQWYNLSKYLCESLSERNTQPYYYALIKDLAQAYRLVADCIDDKRYAVAIHQIQVWKRPKSTFRLARAEKAELSGPLLRESMRTSLVLWREIDPIKDLINADVIPAPGYPYFSPVQWNATRLHVVFSQYEPAKKSVRELITHWLLPRYNLDTALHLARRLRNNRPDRVEISVAKYLFFLITWLLLVIAVGSVMIQIIPTASAGLPISVGETLLGLGGIAGILIRILDVNILPHLAAPRIVGGVMIGYLTIMLENGSIEVNQVLWNNYWGLPALLVLVSVLFAGFTYLYFDVRPLARDGKTSFKRAFSTLVLSFMLASLVGLAVVAVITAKDPVECRHLFCHFTFWGPFGQVNLAYFISFVPMALLAGLVTQFIFEERTVTSPVWSPEEE